MKKVKIRKKIPRKGYCGSLIQQNFGESIENHGYLIWDIINKDIIEKNIENDYKFINININQDNNIDNLKINIPKNDKIKIKVKWEDFSVNMNTENEIKIRNYLKDLTGSNVINIETNPLYVDLNDSKIISDTIDINDILIQQNILKEFLINNKIDENKIEKIIEIDDIINKRLNIKKSKNIKWSIDKFWFNNFKSYGDNNEINWEDKNGIIQIGGLNQKGKSTILDAISYILYGTTISTTKREKNGDNRYINLNRNKDYCDGGAIIDINGEKFLIYRKTERKIKKNGDISSVSTNIDYYKGTDINEDNKLVGEKNINTQKDIENILGDFNDFIRLTFTSADNVNDLLSMDRSVFIDNIIKDAGYDIFDKKLNEFKEYKKELNLEKINLNLEQVLKDIQDNEIKIKEHNNIIISNEILVKNHENDIINYQNDKEKLLFSLNKIDDNILKIDHEKINGTIKNLNDDISEKQSQINKTNVTLLSYPSEFNNDELIDLKNKYETLKDDYLRKVNDIKNIENKVFEKKYDVKKIEDINNNKLNEIKNNNLIKKNSLLNDIKILENDINLIKTEYKKIKTEIESFENTDQDTKICPTCLQKLDNNNIEHFQNEINKRTELIKKLSINGKSKLKEIENLKEKIQLIDNIDIENDNTYIEFLEKNNINKEIIQKDIYKHENDIKSLKENLKNDENDIKSLKENLKNLEDNKERYNFRLKSESYNKDLEIKINNKKIEIKKLESLIDDYKKNKKYIDENKIIQLKIDDINKTINEKTISVKTLNNEIFNNKQNITLKNKIIDDYNNKIDKFNYQKELEFIHNTYLKSMHRDGLPTYLLKKSIHIINNELKKLLSEVNFNLFFDDDLNLKMMSKITSKSYNAVEGSGMERTFNSVTLKIALRKINNTSKPNFILFDEIMNKLVDKSVDEFIELLYTLKNHIDKIILIEHIHQLKYDYFISVKKDDKNISSFDFY